MFTLDSISAGYGPVSVLRNVGLRVPESSVVALLGSNGVGKTTLLRVASGLLTPWSGRLLLDGEELPTGRPQDLVARGICHVPEGRGVFPPLTVRENIRLFSPRGQEKIAVERSIEAFPALKDRLNQVAGTLSGGQQQMLALARAYVSNPRVILLDEVSMGLAPLIVHEIFDFLTRIAAEGVSLLLVEQYVTKALAIADYAYVLGRGQLTFAGDPGELAEEDVFSRYLGLEAAPVGS